MAPLVKDLTVDDLRELIAATVRRTLDEYLNDLRLLAPAVGSRSVEREDPRPVADRPLKPTLDH